MSSKCEGGYPISGNKPCPKCGARPNERCHFPLSFQERVWAWMVKCFGSVIPGDKIERSDRLLEEVLELLQSNDYPENRVIAILSYTYGRPKGEPHQETGGVLVTLAAYCQAHGINMDMAAEDELARVWTKIDVIRAKQAAKPTGSALPIGNSEQLCGDCPPVGYPTDKTRCTPCPRRTPEDTIRKARAM